MRVRAWLPDTPAARLAASALGDELARFSRVAASGLGLRDIGALQVRAIPAEEWSTRWRAEFPVLRIGSIVVRPPWREHVAAPDETIITIDPGQAFGTGLHPTTRLALEGIGRWGAAGYLRSAADPGILDVGTGSGILLAAALALGAPRGVGIDIDAGAIEAAARNLAANGVTERATLVVGSLPSPRGAAPLVVANLVAALHIALAPLLAAAVTPGGRLLVSGIFVDREAEAVAALTATGLVSVDRWSEGEWVAREFLAATMQG